jgi:Tfp pilus assembly protein PilV
VVKEVIVLILCREITENAVAPPALAYDGRSFARKKSKGSSVVEMLVAIFVLVMVLISMFGMFLISRTSMYNKEDETANTIALRYMEELEARPFSVFNTSFSDTRDFGQFSARASVVGTPNDYMAQVRVEVEWEAAAMGNRSVTVERIISAGGSRNVGDHD